MTQPVVNIWRFNDDIRIINENINTIIIYSHPEVVLNLQPFTDTIISLHCGMDCDDSLVPITVPTAIYGQLYSYGSVLANNTDMIKVVIQNPSNKNLIIPACHTLTRIKFVSRDGNRSVHPVINFISAPHTLRNLGE